MLRTTLQYFRTNHTSSTPTYTSLPSRIRKGLDDLSRVLQHDILQMLLEWATQAAMAWVSWVKGWLVLLFFFFCDGLVRKYPLTVDYAYGSMEKYI